jgi:hypothetical protein
MKTNQRHCKVMTCCGSTFPVGFRAKHEAGLLHRNKDHVLELVAEGQGNLEIAKRFGCSRELVRCFLKKLGVEKNKKRNRALDRALSNQTLHAFFAAAAAHGLRTEPVANGVWWYSTKKVRVNSQLIWLRTTRLNKMGHVPLHGCDTPDPVDYVVWEIKGTKDWFIVPWEGRPRHHTTTVLAHRSSLTGMTRDRRHDWPKYRNAWYLLNPKTR